MLFPIKYFFIDYHPKIFFFFSYAFPKNIFLSKIPLNDLTFHNFIHNFKNTEAIRFLKYSSNAKILTNTKNQILVYFICFITI